ncbi:MAG: lysine--tRNA ligase [Pseudomonadales bacterium]|nr:lysine--tRNA ligase [Pseudomonadales bacterium]
MSDDNDIIRVRREKLARWRSAGRAYPNDFRRDALAADLHTRCAELDKTALETAGIEAAVAGRVMLRRVMGKASFITLQDTSGQIQCYLRGEDVGADAYQAFLDLCDIGDIVGIRGVMMRTNKGELSVHAMHFELLNKTLRPLPEKYHGLTDQEVKYRQRYLDLIMNPQSRRVFETRTRAIGAIRTFFVERGFLEVETPMMQIIPGGATARPFITHHNALDLELYLRIAPELYLKRLTVGGFERVFEINRNFRNEGLSTRHNPEFTMLEFYWAYADYRDLMDLTGVLFEELARGVLGSSQVTYQGQPLDFGKPPERMTMAESVARHLALTPREVEDPERLADLLRGMNLPVSADWGVGRLQMELFEARVEDKLQQPTFITQYPAEVSPLSRRNDRNPDLADRFELFVAGREIANGFSELNDPEDQAERFRHQAALKSGGDLEAMHYDQDYVTALEYGLPPTAGEGIGIDRLIMLLTDSASIRDVLLFPLMRPRDG